MPDPLPILDQAIERNQQLASKIQDYEIETKQLRETMGDQANEITELKTKEKKMQELQSLEGKGISTYVVRGKLNIS